ncbi:hypothetical protein AVEN_43879-1 [Araneus ventricosus]|uniref:Mariner Mos1 transposase n=1 Tax=Araneus ventricosus TaxID=182803 RepID=A0A4Y2GQZ6_ARAVE|nr:hypothetical protein AVEN_43879-1 [Araneus ventricosus]
MSTIDRTIHNLVEEKNTRNFSSGTQTRITTGDETWLHNFTPDTKSSSMTWKKHPSSLVTKKFKVSHSAGKVMLTVFWDSKGVILINFFTSGTINASHYFLTFTKLKTAIRYKTPGLLSRGALFLDDNARPNTRKNTKEHILRLGWERLYDPAYSPDLAALDPAYSPYLAALDPAYNPYLAALDPANSPMFPH